MTKSIFTTQRTLHPRMGAQERLLGILTNLELFGVDFSLSSLRILLALHGSGGTAKLTAKQLSLQLSLSTSNISYHLNKLLDYGHVEKVTDSDPSNTNSRHGGGTSAVTYSNPKNTSTNDSRRN